MIKRLLLSLIALLSIVPATFACDVCGAGAKQPEFLREMTHGTTPGGNLDYAIVAAACVLVLFTLVFSVKFLVRPGERNDDHIKRAILTNENSGY